jgi:hypothetical protein
MRQRTVARRRAGGSAFIISLLVIVVVTFLGLTLSTVTSTEMQLGSNDRDLQRSTYACNSGLAVSAARILVRQDALTPGELRTPQPMEAGRPIQLNELHDQFDPRNDASPTRGSRVILSNAVELNEGPAAYTQINNASEKPIFRRGILGFTAWGYRYDTVSSPDLSTQGTPLATRACSTVLDLQPYKVPMNTLYTLHADSVGRDPYLN